MAEDSSTHFSPRGTSLSLFSLWKTRVLQTWPELRPERTPSEGLYLPPVFSGVTRFSLRVEDSHQPKHSLASGCKILSWGVSRD